MTANWTTSSLDCEKRILLFFCHSFSTTRYSSSNGRNTLVFHAYRYSIKIEHFWIGNLLSTDDMSCNAQHETFQNVWCHQQKQTIKSLLLRPQPHRLDFSQGRKLSSAREGIPILIVTQLEYTNYFESVRTLLFVRVTLRKPKKVDIAKWRNCIFNKLRSVLVDI